MEDWQLQVAKEYDSFSVQGLPVRIACHTGHGIGKTALAAWISIHSLLRFGDNISGVVTANTRAQLHDKLVREIRKWVIKGNLSSLLRVTSDSMKFVNGGTGQVSFVTWRIEAPDAFAGLHEKNVLIIFDEASGIPDVIWETLEGATTGHNYCWICLGNPTRQSGFFKRLQDEPEGVGRGWNTHRISTYQVSPDRVARNFIDDMKAKYGEASSTFKIRVLGEYPDKSKGSFFFSKDELDRISGG